MKKLVCLLVLSCMIFGCSKEEEKPAKSKVEIKQNEIYAVPEDPTDYQVKLYNKLTKALTKEDDEKTASLVAQNFAYDFFSLKNKESSMDVGGLTYLPEDRQEDFKTFASSYVYGNYAVIAKEEGKSELPLVKSIKVSEIVAGEFNYTVFVPGNMETGVEAHEEEGTYDGWQVTLALTYEDTKVDSKTLKSETTVTVIDLNGRLVVIAMN